MTALSPWPHRWAVLLCVLTFPLVFVGALVTSTDAGMAVPDWPGTYGYNLFLYPWTTWLFGPWDLFIEHGHRLLASLVGLVAIVTLVVCVRTRAPRAVVWLAVGALVLVIAQGVLGGMRVVLGDRPLAMAHGCLGPLFFAWTALLWVRSSTGWARAAEPGTYRLARWTAAACGVTYVQLCLGAFLRHVPGDPSPRAFGHAVLTHVTLAVVIVGLVGLVWLLSRRAPSKGLRQIATAMAWVAAAQFTLGLGSWAARYALPGWVQAAAPTMTGSVGAAAALGWTQSLVLTAHVAGGALLLALSAAAALIAWRDAKDGH
ncbi:COX15/CtaA family protein [Pirellulimonas nuda]|nr:COX15/CtaA family protein [Pirellulimonas nuda]